jgi:hypothetical protein
MPRHALLLDQYSIPLPAKPFPITKCLIIKLAIMIPSPHLRIGHSLSYNFICDSLALDAADNKRVRLVPFGTMMCSDSGPVLRNLHQIASNKL